MHNTGGSQGGGTVPCEGGQGVKLGGGGAQPPRFIRGGFVIFAKSRVADNFAFQVWRDQTSQPGGGRGANRNMKNEQGLRGAELPFEVGLRPPSKNRGGAFAPTTPTAPPPMFPSIEY